MRYTVNKIKVGWLSPITVLEQKDLSYKKLA